MKYRQLCHSLLLLLLCLPSLLAWKKQFHCRSETPVCQSDRFDVVFDHYDDHRCKVFKCQCRSAQTVSCPNGRLQLQTDSNGCQFYECVTTSVVCPPATTCPLPNQVAVAQGTDANGCPIYTCQSQCPTAVDRPVCNSNEQIQQGVDNNGCTYYYCQQVRSQCPSKPTCSTNQELVSAGMVGTCEVFKCVCLTPTKPACSIGSQARLQDDGLGCQEYRCVENRSPCPAEPVCPSSHQVVAQDGVDANNCVKYACKCIPLSPITCPDGYRQELETDGACGCQYYKCEPNCERKPTCPSPYQHAVVMATRNNGCPSYSCSCKDAEVISCAATDAHLVLTKANDGSNCDVYICQTGNTRSCAVPSCTNPVATGSQDAYGCPVYTCQGDNRNGGCPTVPVCLGGRAIPIGTNLAGCTMYVCHKNGCPMPAVACRSNEMPVLSGYDSMNCPTYMCQPDANGNNRNGGVCAGRPICQTGETVMYTGTSANNCPEYVCHRAGCPQPPTCTVGERLVQSGYSGNCPTYICQSTTRTCSNVPNCPAYQRAIITTYDANNCPIYSCTSSGNSRSCTVPQCSNGAAPISTGTDGLGCPIYVCQDSAGASIGSRSGVIANGVYNNGVYNNGVYNNGMYNNGMYNNGMYNNGMYNNGMYNNGMYNNGMYNNGVYNNGVYGNGVYNNGMYANGVLNTDVRSGLGVLNNAYGVRATGTGVVGISSGCPQTPECQYQQFRITHRDMVNGAVCEMTNCINLGDYTGEPKKCLDNPTHCDISQTVETFLDKRGRKRSRACQRVVCKGSANIAVHY